VTLVTVVTVVTASCDSGDSSDSCDTGDKVIVVTLVTAVTVVTAVTLVTELYNKNWDSRIHSGHHLKSFSILLAYYTCVMNNFLSLMVSVICK